MKNKHVLIAISDCILLLFLGLVYAWSVFKKPLAMEFGWSDGMLTWTFTICMSFFCLGGFFAAKITKRIKHQIVVLGSGITIFIGFFLASNMTHIWQLYIYYGIMIGFSVGTVYNCVLSTGNRWFAKNAGMMSGIFLMCFGSGSLIFGPLSTALMNKIGWSKTFVILGILFVIVFFITSFQVAPPNENYVLKTEEKVSTSDNDIKALEMIKHKNFWFYITWSTLFSAVGLGLVGQVFTISSSFHMSDMTSSYMVSLVAVCNGIGRFFFGTIYDMKGRKLTMNIISFGTIIGVVLLSIAVKNNLPILLYGAFIFMGFGYGGITPNNSNFIRNFFGTENYPMNFSIVNFNLLVSVFIGQYVGSKLYMLTGTYFYSAIAMLVLCIVGFICNVFIKDKIESNGI